MGLAKRLTPDVQAFVIKDLEAAKCIPNTSEESEPAPIYEMNVNILEGIARLPGELQKPAYEAIKASEMDKKEALTYLRSIKRDAETLKLADDVKGVVDSYADQPAQEQEADLVLSKHLKKIDREVERLSVSVKSQDGIDKEEVAMALESLIERLEALYAEVKAQDKDSRSSAPAT